MSEESGFRAREALVEAIVRNRPLLIRLAMRILGCRHRAEDVVHDICLRVMEDALESCVEQPAHYLFRMVRNRAIDVSRRVLFESRNVESDESESGATRHGGPESTMLLHERLEVLADAILELPERTRLAFRLHRVEGYKQKEIAALLRVSPTLVNFMIRDAHARCEAALVRLDGPSPRLATPVPATHRAV